MAVVVFKLQCLIIIVICFHSRSSYGFKLPYNGAKIITYGEPCHPPRYLPVTIEEPAEPVTELVLPEPCRNYQPLKLKYRVTSTEPVFYQPQAEYPIAVEVPEVPQPLEIITPDQDFQGKSYTYSIQAPLLPSSTPISRRYDFDFEVPSTSPVSTVPTPKSVKLLTGLTTKIDRVLIPACEVPFSSCCNGKD